jgi:glycosyltransferase involved in cell wall biosynthesis
MIAPAAGACPRIADLQYITAGGRLRRVDAFMTGINRPPGAKLRHGVVIVSSDAGRTGAPLIALNIARELVEGLGIPVVTLLLAPGELEADFAQLGPVFVVRSYPAKFFHARSRHLLRVLNRAIQIAELALRGGEDRFWRKFTRYLAKRQICHAVCNTVVSGDAAIRLKCAGVTSIGLIHELPHSIRARGWTDRAAALVEGARAVVFPCPQVRAAFGAAFALGDKPNFVFPQGLGIGPGELVPERRAVLRSAFRSGLGLACDEVLILGCGEDDFRKGIDLFVQAVRELARSSTEPCTKRIVFAWAGRVNPSFRVWAEKDLIKLNLTDRLFFLGPQQDMVPAFAAADIFFLPSREDPFPNVVLEAMASGLPVVGFAGTGGFEEQARGGAGVTVPYCDVASAVNVMRELAERPDERESMGRLGRERIALSGGYRLYVARLVEVLTAETAPDRESRTDLACGEDTPGQPMTCK